MERPDPAALSAQLSGESARAVPARLGGNSRVFHVTTESGKEYALKIYPRDSERDRLGQEFAALTFLHEAGIVDVPKPVARREPDAGLFTWIHGTAVERVPGDLAQMAQFLARVHAARLRPAARSVRLATEAVLSSRELEEQCSRRIARLAPAAAQHAGLREVVTAIGRELKVRLVGCDWPELPQTEQTLSPSDLGFHNALRGTDGRLRFVDFEYFGWDDPVKLVSDVIWHPGHRLSAEEAMQFRVLTAEIYGTGREFEARFAAFFPLFGLRWALIVLNQFLREGREPAGKAGDRLEAQERQLAKARDFVERVRASKT